MKRISKSGFKPSLGIGIRNRRWKIEPDRWARLGSRLRSRLRSRLGYSLGYSLYGIVVRIRLRLWDRLK
jgi:hypothetical protein